MLTVAPPTLTVALAALTVEIADRQHENPQETRRLTKLALLTVGCLLLLTRAGMGTGTPRSGCRAAGVSSVGARHANAGCRSTSTRGVCDASTRGRRSGWRRRPTIRNDSHELLDYNYERIYMQTQCPGLAPHPLPL